MLKIIAWHDRKADKDGCDLATILAQAAREPAYELDPET
jgi:predicted nucleotidyltransferase